MEDNLVAGTANAWEADSPKPGEEIHILTPEEEEERAKLRAEYLKAFRASFRGQLENTYLVDEDGNERKLGRKA